MAPEQARLLHGLLAAEQERLALLRAGMIAGEPADRAQVRIGRLVGALGAIADPSRAAGNRAAGTKTYPLGSGRAAAAEFAVTEARSWPMRLRDSLQCFARRALRPLSTLGKARRPADDSGEGAAT